MDKTTARETLAETIRARRGAKQISIAQLSQQTGIDYKTLRSRLKGESDWRVGELMSVADALDADAGEWVNLYRDAA
ncbi:helix-turn-helix domain-containing protein [Cryobacterium sp. BB736]|uniref:helix-turn-helix domain-containing protein n=1 Tax=Cryobacterium sp. BB736 TaxID=2746963 RepID=UPI00187433B1|nr:helix-turn-helix transcriptional regulator [Cryobacterium sp. BB736]